MDRDHDHALEYFRDLAAVRGHERPHAFPRFDGCICPIEQIIPDAHRVETTGIWFVEPPGFTKIPFPESVVRFMARLYDDQFDFLAPAQPGCPREGVHFARCPESVTTRLRAA